MSRNWWTKRRTLNRWEMIRRRGHLRHIGLMLIIMLCSYAAVRLMHVALFRLGWVASTGVTTLEGVVFDAVLPAVILAELDWADMKRRFSLRPGEDRTMV